MGEIHNVKLFSISFQSFILLLLNEKTCGEGDVRYKLICAYRLTGGRELIHTGLAAHNSNSELEAKNGGDGGLVLSEKQSSYSAGSVRLYCASEMYNMSPWLLNLWETC